MFRGGCREKDGGGEDREGEAGVDEEVDDENDEEVCINEDSIPNVGAYGGVMTRRPVLNSV